MSGKLSIMSVELTAILEALFYVKSLIINKLLILSDSKSSLQDIIRCAKGRRSSSPIAYKIVKTIEEFRVLGKTVSLQWIPLHIGLYGNERVDKIAKEAVVSGFELDVKPMYTTLTGTAKTKCKNNWKEYFDLRSKEKGIWYKTIQSEPPCNPWFDGTRLSRKYLITAFRLRSGHVQLNKFAFLMKKVPSPNCNLCNVPEDAYHLLNDCERTKLFRQRLKWENSNLGSYIEYLGRPSSEIAGSIYKMYAAVIAERNNNM